MPTTACATCGKEPEYYGPDYNGDGYHYYLCPDGCCDTAYGETEAVAEARWNEAQEKPLPRTRPLHQR